MSASSRKRNLGEIGFARRNAHGGWTFDSIMGAERVRLLKLAVAGEPLPDGLLLVGQREGGGYELITREAFKEESIEYYKLRARSQALR